MDFYETKMGRTFFEYQFPELISVLKRLAYLKEEELSLLKQRSVTLGQKTNDMPAENMKGSNYTYVYLCYEENSAALYADAGNVNRVYITDDPTKASQWIAMSRHTANESGYYALSKDEVDSFFEDFKCGEPASLWVYKDGNENSSLNYGICCDRFDLREDKNLLSLFCQEESIGL